MRKGRGALWGRHRNLARAGFVNSTPKCSTDSSIKRGVVYWERGGVVCIGWETRSVTATRRSALAASQRVSPRAQTYGRSADAGAPDVLRVGREKEGNGERARELERPEKQRMDEAVNVIDTGGEHCRPSAIVCELFLLSPSLSTLFMSTMPPSSISGSVSGGKKKNRKDTGAKNAVHPVQEVQPTPQRTYSLSDKGDFPDLGLSCIDDKVKPRAVITVEPEGITREIEGRLIDMGDDDNSVDEIESAREETEREGPSEPERPVRQSKGQQPKQQKQPAAPSKIYPKIPKPSAQIDLLSQSPPTPPRTGQGSLNQQTAALPSPSGSLNSSVSPAPTSLKSGRERTPSINYIKGQVSKPVPAPQMSIVGSVAELVHDVIPRQSTPQLIQPEKTEWVQIFTVDKVGCPSKQLHVILTGLARGYQLWTVGEQGECEEVVSERQGPIRACRVLPNNVRVPEGQTDRFASHRPLLALVDATSMEPDRQYCTVRVISLTSGSTVENLKFDEPICALHTSNQFLVVSLVTKIVVFNLWDLRENSSFKIASTVDGCPPSVAVYGEMLAFADTRLNPEILSCGGYNPENEKNPDTYTEHVVSAMKAFGRTMTSLSESVSGSNLSVHSKDIVHGVVSVVDLSKEDPSTSRILHFLAHTSPVSFIQFSPDGRLLLTANAAATVYHLFLLQPHPTSPTLGAVQHLYKLKRGSTAAKVVSASFSLDCRWLAVSTNHGTCHIFSVCPFGGKPTQRTHGENFTNKESRFLRSAGLVDSSSADALNGSRSRTASGQAASSHSSIPSREHISAVGGNRALARASGNPRIGPFPPPVALYAVAKIPGEKFSADNLTAWALDIASPLTSAGGKKQQKTIDAPRIAVSFMNGPNPSSANTMLLIARDDGVVWDYELRPKIVSAKSSEDPPKLDIVSRFTRTLQRTKNNSDIRTPLQQGSPLMAWGTDDSDKRRQASGDDSWVSKIEITTYSGPARRLWTGPQFTFFVYNEEDSAVLVRKSKSKYSSHVTLKYSKKNL
ncbi:hypothetical protein WR25_03603 [Diploscapter pachys]|uniref:BCAS3 WD40 domain-containing protein n=1 Tax=Diploscapter pachys TaxID=2018661 RepID=A0A2A2J5Q6_9BILA|nr:hypothetical protein WR25_03603 [Diploscapter pachys]